MAVSGESRAGKGGCQSSERNSAAKKTILIGETVRPADVIPPKNRSDCSSGTIPISLYMLFFQSDSSVCVPTTLLLLLFCVSNRLP